MTEEQRFACGERDEPQETQMLREILLAIKEESGYDSAATRIEEIERRYVAAASDGGLVFRQLAARWCLIAATDKGGSFEQIAYRFRRACEVGLGGPHSEMAVLVEFAEACRVFGQWEEGLRVLALARERLPHWGFKRQAEAEEQIDRLRRRLENRQTE